MADESPKSEIILYQAEDGRTRIQCRFENETIWLASLGSRGDYIGPHSQGGEDLPWADLARPVGAKKSNQGRAT